jgi:MFS family permease
MYLAGRSSDRLGERRYHFAIPALGAAVFLIAAILADGNLPLTLVALTLGTACLWMAYTVFWAIPSQLVEGTAAAGGIALINTVGLSGGFWGPAVVGWTKAGTGSMHAGLFVMACAAALAAVLILKGKLTLKQE